jgi:hypothetical protein
MILPSVLPSYAGFTIHWKKVCAFPNADGRRGDKTLKKECFTFWRTLTCTLSWDISWENTHFLGKYLRCMGYAPIIGGSDRLEISMSAGLLRKTGIRWASGIRPFQAATRANGRGHEKRGAAT